MGQTRVDLRHLLEDLRDAYPGALEETILTEIVANSLDSGARDIRFTISAPDASIAIADDGSGMKRRELARFHDIAATTKTRGQGIGFAGVGIKLGLLIAEEVVTETRCGKTHVATRWHLASRHKAPWKWVPPPGLIEGRGTAVQLRLTNPLSPLLDPGFVEGVLHRHYRPLFEAVFRAILAAHYPDPVRFFLNGRELAPEAQDSGAEIAPIEVRLARKRKASAIGYLVRERSPIEEDRRGIAIATFGKIIRRGWDWLGIVPGDPERIGGLIEVPALAECLTLNKADFIRSGQRGATYLAYRRAIQAGISNQFTAWGERREVVEQRRRSARPVERDLERVLGDLAEDYPLLATLVERHEGGQRRLPMGNGEQMVSRRIAPAVLVGARALPPPAEASPSDEPQAVAGQRDLDESDPLEQEAVASPEAPAAPVLQRPGSRRPGRYGLHIQFESREDSNELGRLVQSAVLVNESHPAFTRAAASRSEGYHIALSVAAALAPLAAEPANERTFMTQFLARWGAALKGSGRRR